MRTRCTWSYTGDPEFNQLDLLLGFLFPSFFAQYRLAHTDHTSTGSSRALITVIMVARSEVEIALKPSLPQHALSTLYDLCLLCLPFHTIQVK